MNGVMYPASMFRTTIATPFEMSKEKLEWDSSIALEYPSQVATAETFDKRDEILSSALYAKIRSYYLLLIFERMKAFACIEFDADCKISSYDIDENKDDIRNIDAILDSLYMALTTIYDLSFEERQFLVNRLQLEVLEKVMNIQ